MSCAWGKNGRKAPSIKVDTSRKKFLTGDEVVGSVLLSLYEPTKVVELRLVATALEKVEGGTHNYFEIPHPLIEPLKEKDTLQTLNAGVHSYPFMFRIPHPGVGDFALDNVPAAIRYTVSVFLTHKSKFSKKDVKTRHDHTLNVGQRQDLSCLHHGRHVKGSFPGVLLPTVGTNNSVAVGGGGASQSDAGGIGGGAAGGGMLEANENRRSTLSPNENPPLLNVVILNQFVLGETAINMVLTMVKQSRSASQPVHPSTVRYTFRQVVYGRQEARGKKNVLAENIVMKGEWDMRGATDGHITIQLPRDVQCTVYARLIEVKYSLIVEMIATEDGRTGKQHWQCTSTALPIIVMDNRNSIPPPGDNGADMPTPASPRTVVKDIIPSTPRTSMNGVQNGVVVQSGQPQQYQQQQPQQQYDRQPHQPHQQQQQPQYQAVVAEYQQQLQQQQHQSPHQQPQQLQQQQHQSPHQQPQQLQQQQHQSPHQQPQQLQQQQHQSPHQQPQQLQPQLQQHQQQPQQLQQHQQQQHQQASPHQTVPQHAPNTASSATAPPPVYV